MNKIKCCPFCGSDKIDYSICIGHGDFFNFIPRVSSQHITEHAQFGNMLLKNIWYNKNVLSMEKQYGKSKIH